MTLRTKDVDLNKLNDIFKTLTDMFYVLGLNITYITLNDEDKALYNEYIQSKANKDFATSDIIRAKLIEKKIL